MKVKPIEEETDEALKFQFFEMSIWLEDESNQRWPTAYTIIRNRHTLINAALRNRHYIYREGEWIKREV